MTTRLEPVWRTVPVEPTAAMLQGACEKHTPGQPMSKDRPDECPRFETRRRIYAKMLQAAPAPDGMREAIARIIDPISWEALDVYGQDKAAFIGFTTDKSLARADAILAIIAKGEGR